MERYFKIDGKSSQQYLCTLREGSVKALLAYPPLKAYTSNDWHEEDGIEADLSAPVLDARQFDLPLYFGSLDGYRTFFAKLSETSYHTVEVPEIGYSKKLRYVSAGQPTVIYDMILASVRFSDDYPLDGYVYQAPTYNAVSGGLWGIDGHSFDSYGIQILEGSRSNAWKLPPVKENLTRNIATLPGVIHDDHASKSKSQDITIKCYMSHDAAEAFTAAWNALLYDLSKPGARTIHGDIFGGLTMTAVYKSSTVGEALVSNGIHVVFDLVFTTLIES